MAFTAAKLAGEACIPRDCWSAASHARAVVYSFLHSLAGYTPTVNVGKLFSHAPRMAQITAVQLLLQLQL